MERPKKWKRILAGPKHTHTYTHLQAQEGRHCKSLVVRNSSNNLNCSQKSRRSPMWDHTPQLVLRDRATTLINHLHSPAPSSPDCS
eukprot:1159286-Pelagomonas_calceolata.AAC.4